MPVFTSLPTYIDENFDTVPYNWWEKKSVWGNGNSPTWKKSDVQIKHLISNLILKSYLLELLARVFYFMFHFC